MKPEKTAASFFQVLDNRPELFTRETQEDLTQLEIAVDRVEYIREAEQLDFLADAIIDFCDVNPAIYQALNETMNQSDEIEATEKTFEEIRLLLSKKIRSLLTYSSEL